MPVPQADAMAPAVLSSRPDRDADWALTRAAAVCVSSVSPLGHQLMHTPSVEPLSPGRGRLPGTMSRHPNVMSSAFDRPSVPSGAVRARRGTARGVTNFWIFPDAVSGNSSTNTQMRGALYVARCSRRKPTARRRRRLRRQRDGRTRRPARPTVVGDADHGDVGDIRMREQQVLDLARIDVLAAADDHVLEPAFDAAGSRVRPSMPGRRCGTSRRRRSRSAVAVGFSKYPCITM